ncbi:hypothetical protein NL676_024077 [Syzygium grande]|nr:hypothetical protein NL676_024077 [Syzygium grande]
MPPSSCSSSFSSGSFMERKKSGRRGSAHELALAKAAAWAWYERWSWSERKPIREYDIMGTPRALRPSQYKQEAKRLAQLAKVQDEKEKEKEDSLMDPYEVHMISRHLDRFKSLVESTITTTPVLPRSGFITFTGIRHVIAGVQEK